MTTHPNTCPMREGDSQRRTFVHFVGGPLDGLYRVTDAHRVEHMEARDGDETSARSAAAGSDPSLGRFGEADGGQSPHGLPKARARRRDVVHRLGAFGRAACSADGWTTSDSAKITCPECRGGGA